MADPFGGVWPAMVTPLDPEGNPDFESLEQLVELFVQQGLGGIYSVGSTGQWPLLPMAQRQTVAERVVQTAAGRIPVVVHVGAVATDDAVELARHAESIGADGVSSVAPIYYPSTADQIFLHYRRIGEASQLPLYVYHLSHANQISLSPKQYAERVLELPNIAGMKITDDDLYTFGRIAEVASPSLRLFSGSDPLVCHAALAGAIGAIGTFFNLWGRSAQKARQAFVSGDFQIGREFSRVIQNAIDEVISSKSIWTFMNSAMKIAHGVEIGMPRPPLGSCDQMWPQEDVERILATFAPFDES